MQGKNGIFVFFVSSYSNLIIYISLSQLMNVLPPLAKLARQEEGTPSHPIQNVLKLLMNWALA